MPKMLGILELENRPISHVGALCAEKTHPFPLKRLTVEGANVAKLVSGDSSVRNAYISAARKLEREGVSAITTNCGFSSLYQNDVAASVNVPVIMSSLALVPFVAPNLPKGMQVGILTYDSTKLLEIHLEGAGWSSADFSVAIGGIEGSLTWKLLADPEPDASREVITDDVLNGVRALIKAEPTIGAIVLECAGFTLAGDAVRSETGLMVADFVTLANILMEISPPNLAAR
ncbi:hypothetical protein IVB55_00210 [Bradyrhizobium sp. CW4]|uniref:hypothetical protein n=1 Tax=Bradyrhizobium sp. CW4 TaxID=2782687 RepID=UPI001FF9CC97|nr:hypothetical protein [Bradyrhizobium sp. CW4]MCK1411537.1 hypothetical protein [Bradyrhizobium sp. CW4]